MSGLLRVPEPGQLVDVRCRRYVVLDIVQSYLPIDLLTTPVLSNRRTQHLITLSSVEDDALGEELQVIWEVEPEATTIEKTPLCAEHISLDDNTLHGSACRIDRINMLW
ncbi:hypothetical protein KSF_096760 [Reticulibacter mediterranei]|uniref:Uncharacterized protein n=1 Tax=Reticulibacter mediterranei TaxID=2778369 RepID=A0A8J3IW42_9CHLR|nr:hypothetical protein [Reticulibacter mediterranei]GHO99628.1 hypothetical protein KSF_096760 [Reticulibacter mediterranei]